VQRREFLLPVQKSEWFEKLSTSTNKQTLAFSANKCEVVANKSANMPAEYEFVDQLKNDFQNAKKRNLHTWTQWRIRLNGKLVEAVLDGAELKDVEPIMRFMNREVPDPAHPTTNPKTLLSYSAAENTSTNLRRKNFYKYGIPRAKLDPSKQETMMKLKLKNSLQAGLWHSTLELSSAPPPLAEGDFALDYFNYDENNAQSPVLSGNAKLTKPTYNLVPEAIADRDAITTSRHARYR